MRECENPACRAPASDVCNDCKLVRYCSRECQRLRWPQHRDACRLEKMLRSARAAAAVHVNKNMPAITAALARSGNGGSRERHAGRVYTLIVGGTMKIGVISDGGGGGGEGDLRERSEDAEGRGPKLPPGEWRYRNCLRRAYDAADKKINGVIFPTSRHGAFEHRIDFNAAVTEAEAVEAAERFLSEPHDEAYYERVKTDLFFNPKPGTVRCLRAAQGPTNVPRLQWWATPHPPSPSTPRQEECYAYADVKDMCYDMRGSLLTDLKYLDSIYLLEKVPGGIYYLGCGS